MSDKESRECKPRETHGKRLDINDDTPISKVKAPNVFERMKEEIEAIVETIHPHKQTKDPVFPLEESKRRDEVTNSSSKLEKPDSASQEKVKSPHKHHKETHGRSNDFDENTPVDEVKGPNMFERAKEEIEALVDAFHHKDKSDKIKHSSK